MSEKKPRLATGPYVIEFQDLDANKLTMTFAHGEGYIRTSGGAMVHVMTRHQFIAIANAMLALEAGLTKL